MWILKKLYKKCSSIVKFKGVSSKEAREAVPLQKIEWEYKIIVQK